jgi:hypothetical protein
MDQLEKSEDQLNNKEVIIRRDSFDDRICDDFCELLVSYLTFEEKLKLESVFYFQNSIVLITCDEWETRGKDSLKLMQNFNKNNILSDEVKIDLKAFESILKRM